MPLLAVTYTSGRFTLEVTPRGAVTITTAGGDTLLCQSVAQWGRDSLRTSFSDFAKVSSHSSQVATPYGLALRVTIEGSKPHASLTSALSALHTKATLIFNLYPDFITTSLAVADAATEGLNYMAPIATTSPYQFSTAAGNYAISVPYDNDAWVRYQSSPFGAPHRESYELTALLNADTRQGLVIGSLEHDTWKSAIDIATSRTATIDTLIAYAGASSELTRDVRPHGCPKPSTINHKPTFRSPLFVIAPVDDWRDGMELYADLCERLAPKIACANPVRPFGWNSWGKLKTDINRRNAAQTSDFFAQQLQPGTFHAADSSVVINLDSFWSSDFRTPDDHRAFVAHCRANGQKAGIYYCPFADFGRQPERTVSEVPQYRYDDLYLRHDGKPLLFDGAFALDPTHPGTKARLQKTFDNFKDWGYEYVKIDFMAHGAYQADSYYDPSVTTGNQAYAHGMAFIDSVADGKLWINLSIAPLFPANFAHSRRISCDAWADINNTEYVLNALTYGWWLDHVYHFNDADHMVMEGATDGENRARVTSSAITGVFFLGDDLSDSHEEGIPERVVRNLTNPEVTEMVRQCRAFRPVEIGSGDRAADTFVYELPDCLYVAAFNLSDTPKSLDLPLRRLGLSESRDYQARELWSHDASTAKGHLMADIPAKDVKLFKIDTK